MVLPLLGAIAPIAGSLIGGLLGNAGKEKEIANQKEFAQSGIQWRVADAQKAGIHPALAMGANVPSYTPVGLGTDLAESASNMGQDISRAIDATSTQSQRSSAFLETQQRLTLENMGLQNELLRAEILGLTRPRVPAFPGSETVIDGQGDTAIPIPLLGGSMKVKNPKLAQTAQDHFGEPFEWLFGGGNFLESALASIPGSLAWAGEQYKKTPIRGSHLYK